MTPKEEYTELIHSGMFWEFFPTYSGIWVIDSIQFIRFLIKRKQLQNERI